MSLRDSISTSISARRWSRRSKPSATAVTSWSSSGGSDSDSTRDSWAASTSFWDSFSLRTVTRAPITDAYRSAPKPGNSVARTAARWCSPVECTARVSPMASTTACLESAVERPEDVGVPAVQAGVPAVQAGVPARPVALGQDHDRCIRHSDLVVPVPGEFVEHGQAHRQDVFWHGHPGRDEIPERVTRGLGSEALQQLDVSGLLEAVVLAQGPDEHTSHLAASARTALSTTAQLCRAPPRASHHRPPSRSHGQCAAADDEHRTTFDGECRSDRPGLEAVTSSRRRLARASSASATGASTPRSAATAGSSTLNPLSITARTSTQAVTLHCAGSPRIAAGSGTFALCRAGMPPTQTEAAVDFDAFISRIRPPGVRTPPDTWECS